MRRIDSLQASILLFFQALGLQVIFYPLILLNILRKPQVVVRSPKIIIGSLIIAFSVFSLAMRGASVDMIVNAMRFYFGVLIVYIAFHVNPRFRITNISLWIFAVFCISEFLSFYLGLTFFSYSQIDKSGVSSESRIMIGEGVARVIGPALNSSISGSILAISFFIALKYINQFSSRDKQIKYLLLFIFLAFLSTGSTTAWIVFIFCGVNYFFCGRMKSKLTYSNVYLFVFLAIAAFALLQIEFLMSFIGTLISEKLNFDYFDFVLSDKYLTLLANLGLSMGDIFLGADLSMLGEREIGGDFVMLNFITLFGWPTVIIFISYLLCICAKEFRFFLLAGLLTSMHYGTVFNLTGQLFFGALMAGSVIVSKENYSKS